MCKDTKRNRVIVPLLLVILIAAILSKLSVTFHQEITSDMVHAALQWDDIWGNHNYFLKDWYFSNNTFLLTNFPFYIISGLIFGFHLFAIRLVTFLIFLTSLLLFALILYRAFGWQEALLASLFLATTNVFDALQLLFPYSHMNTLNYCFLCLLMILGIIMSSTPPAESGKPKNTVTAPLLVLFIVSSMALFSDFYFFLFIFAFPALSAYLTLRLFKITILDRKQSTNVITVTITSIAAGILLQQILIRSGFHIAGQETAFTSLPGFAKNVSLYASSIWNFFVSACYSPGPRWVCMVMQVLGAFILICTVGSGYIAMSHTKEPSKRFVILYFFYVFLFLSIAFLASTMPRGTGSARYLIPALYTGALFFSLGIIEKEGDPRRLQRAVVLIFLITCLYNIFQNANYRAEQKHLNLSRILEEKGLSYGYSSFWHANIVTYLTMNQVKVRPVSINRGMIRPLLFDSKSTWYDASNHQGQTFLIVPREGDLGQEAGIVKLEPEYIESHFGEPQAKFNAEDMDIYVWPCNIMPLIENIEYVYVFTMGKDIIPPTGKLETSKDYKYGHIRTGEKGFMMILKLPFLDAGKYRARYILKAVGKKGDTIAEISFRKKNRYDGSAYEKPIVKEIESTAEPRWHEYVLNFEAGAAGSGPEEFEFKAYATGQGDMKMKKLILEKLSR